MSAPRTSGRLLRCYPPAWRKRYGEELESLIVESSGGDRVPWRMRADVMRSAARERLRAAGLSGYGGADDRARGGALLVLCAWALFVLAGAVVQRFSEHWRGSLPALGRGLPSGAFDVLVIAAVCAGVLVLVGLGMAIPSLAAFVRDGGWRVIRRRIVRATLLTGVVAAATIALVVWAHGLTRLERNGHDASYSIAFVAWGALIAACLWAWTAAAVATARRLRLSVTTLRTEARIACAVAIAMVVMTTATAVWWAALADAAPWFLAGGPIGSSGSPLAPQLLGAGAAMLLASLLGAAGAQRAIHALPGLSSAPPD